MQLEVRPRLQQQCAVQLAATPGSLTQRRALCSRLRSQQGSGQQGSGLRSQQGSGLRSQQGCHLQAQ